MPLSPEAQDVLALSATGLTNVEVAECMAHSPATIRRALVSAMNKLGAHSKLESLIIALCHGLIESLA